MATPTLTVTKPAKGVLKATWSAFTTLSDTGQLLNAPNYPDKTFFANATGAFFLTGTVTIEGAMASGGPWIVMNDSRGEGNNFTFTTTDVKVLNENPLWIRPRLTTATTNTIRKIYITALCQSTRR